MKKLRILSLWILVAVSMCLWVSAADYTWTAEDESYTLTFQENSDGTLTLSGYVPGTATDVDVVIPQEVEGKAVTVVGKEAFYKCTYTGTLTLPESLRSIKQYAFSTSQFTGDLVIPEGVTEIGDSAFSMCSSFQGTLTLPSTVQTIGSSAFRYGGFTGSLVLPENLSVMGKGAFYACSNFTGDLVIPGSLKEVPAQAFYYCPKMEGTLTVSPGVESLGEESFYNSGFSGELQLPDTLKSIGKNAFMNRSKLTGTLTLKEGLTFIGENAFSGCTGLTGLQLPDSLTTIQGKAFYNCTGLSGELVLPQNLEVLGYYAFGNCTGFTGNLTIPGSLKAIGANAFASCKGFTGLTISEGVEEIYEYAFNNCSGFTGTLEFPSTLKNIQRMAFSRCTGFTGDLILPEGLTSLADRAFDGCSGLNGDLYVPGSLKEIPKQAFYQLRGITGSITLGEGVEKIGEQAFYYCDKAAGTLTLPVSLKTVGNQAFQSCGKLTGDLNLPAGISEIGANAFSYCSLLTGNLVISETVETLGSSAFSGCSSLNSVTLPGNLTEIPAYLFSGCSGLKGQLNLPDGLTCIRNNAFYSCAGLSGQLVIPDSVTEIGDYAFYGCTGFFGAFDLPEKLEKLGAYALSGVTGIHGSVTWPKGLTYLGDRAFEKITELVFSADLPDCLTYIGDYVFSQKESFSGALELPESLVEIGDYAFDRCHGLYGQLQLPATLETVGKGAFMHCSGLTGNLIIPIGVTKIGDSAFGGCTGLGGTLKIPYGLTHGSSPFPDDAFSILWIPADVTTYWQVLRCAKDTNAAVYFGGTQEYLDKINEKSYQLYPGFHFESYPVLDLILDGEKEQSCVVGNPFKLTAQYYNNKALEDISFTWQSSDDTLFRLEAQKDQITSRHFTGKTEITVVPLKPGTGTITVIGPDGLSDTKTLTVTGRKVLTFLPEEGQYRTKPNAVAPEKTITLSFRYETSGSAEAEWEQIQWTVEPTESSTKEPSEIALSPVSAEVIDENTVKMTVTVTGKAMGAPVEVTLKAAEDCVAKAIVIVPADEIFFKDAEGNKPEKGDKALYSVKTGEDFTVLLEYRSGSEAEVVDGLLKDIAFKVSSEDFMIHPDDRAEIAGDPVRRHSEEAHPLEISWEDHEDGTWTIKAVFAAALEGACGLEVQVGDYTTDTCLVQAAFDSDAYLAQLLHDPSIPVTQNVYEMLWGGTPATAILEVLKEDGLYQGAKDLWSVLKNAFELSEKPSSLYELSVKEEDMYYGMLLEVLYGMMQQDMNAAIYGGIQYGNDLMKTITECFQMVYEVDITKLDPSVAFPDTTRKTLLVKSFEAKHSTVKGASDIMKKADLIADVGKHISDTQDRLTAAIMLRSISQSMTSALEEMLKACDTHEYENEAALRSAIEKCLAQVNKSSDEAVQDVMTGKLAATGVWAVGKIVDNMWDNVMDNIKLSHPAVAMIYVSYHSGTLISNWLCETDVSLLKYYQLVALQDIKAAARDAHDTLSDNWTNDPAAYTATIKLLFQTHLMDCDHALNYVDELDDALAGRLYELVGGDGFDNAEEAFQSFRANVKVLDETTRILWLDYVGRDYQGVLLEEGYEKAFARVMGVKRETFFACPVDIFVLDGKEVIASVEGSSVFSQAEDVTVMLDGTRKVVTFLSDKDYAIRVLGTGEGVMNVTDLLYGADGTVKEKLEYNALPVETNGEYWLTDFEELQNGSGETVAPDADSREKPQYKLTMVSGTTEEELLRAGQNVAVSAVVPEGYAFAGWVCSSGDAVIADPDAPVTSLRMPAENVTLTARLTVSEMPEDRLILVDQDGYIFRELPEESFTLMVKSEEICLAAAYSAEGRMLWANFAETKDGIAQVSLDNREGEIERVVLFRIDSLQDPKPTADLLERAAAK